MRWWLISIVATLAAYGTALAARPSSEPLEPSAIPDDYKAAVEQAELWGRALFESYVSPRAENDAEVRVALETARAAATDLCGETYRAVAVKARGAPRDRLIIYYIAEIPRERGLLVGRHFRVETTADGAAVLSVTPSDDSCLSLGPRPDRAVAAYVTRFLSPTPTEFHVFMSLYYKERIHVGTTAGIWAVAGGGVRYWKSCDALTDPAGHSTSIGDEFLTELLCGFLKEGMNATLWLVDQL